MGDPTSTATADEQLEKRPTETQPGSSSTDPRIPNAPPRLLPDSVSGQPARPPTHQHPESQQDWEKASMDLYQTDQELTHRLPANAGLQTSTAANFGAGASTSPQAPPPIRVRSLGGYQNRGDADPSWIVPGPETGAQQQGALGELANYAVRTLVSCEGTCC